METKYYHKNSDVLAFKKIKEKDGYGWEATYDKNGNQLTFKARNGYSWEATYDKNGNQLTFKARNGYSCEYTYDERGNQLTFKSSDGFSTERTYDKKGNQLTYKDAFGCFEIKGQLVTKEEFEEFINNPNRPCVGKLIIVDGIVYELK